MQDLTPEQYARLQEVFLRAGAMPEADRPAFVQSEFRDDPALMAAYEALGDERDIPTAFLDPIAEDFVAGFQDEHAKWRDPASIGPSVGRYRLLSLLGEGGFGMVYEAEQTEPVRRRVAVKVIKPGQDSRAVINRFEAERQALALMDHPYIAKILDGGTTGPESGHQGLPYFAMELVRGDPITVFCDRERLTIAQRLELMGSVCDAVEHAHKRGIIHRDIKPSNVLVAFHDGVAVPKIIDFGIAKAIGSGLTEHTIYTMRGQLIGTPAYMSPEQAERSGVEIDARTDVYSLGVLLYEVLTSRPPFDPRTLQSAGHAEMVRIIREVAPQRPSTRLSTQGLSDEDHESAVAVARARRAELHALTRQLRSDLDWVVMKCLEKERDRRYASAGELSDELQRILNHEPVRAGPPSLRYRMKKFTRRRRGALKWAAVLALVTATLVSVIVVQEIRNQAWRTRTLGSGAFAATISGTDASELASSPAFENAEPQPLPGVVDPEDEDSIRELLMVRRSGRALDEAQRSLGYAAIAKQLEALVAQSLPARRENQVLLAEVLLLHGDIVCGLRRPGLGDAELARRGYERALVVVDALPANDPRRPSLTARAQRGLGDALRNADVAEAERAYAAAKSTLEAQIAASANDPAARDAAERRLDEEELNLGIVLARQCRLSQAERAITRSIAGRRERMAREQDDMVSDLMARRGVGVGLAQLTDLRLLQGRLPDAEQAAIENYAIRVEARADLMRGRDELSRAFERRFAAAGRDVADAAPETNRMTASFRRDVAIARLMLAQVKSLRGAHAEAAGLLGESDGELTVLHNEAAKDDRLAADLVEVALAAAENEIAAANAAEALRWTERATERLVHLEQLSEQRSDRPVKLGARAAYLDGIALALAGRAEAVGRLESAVGDYEALSVQDPFQSEYARMLARSLAALAGARMQFAGNRTEAQIMARAEFERALGLLEHWNGQNPMCGVTDAERAALRATLTAIPGAQRP